MKRAKKRGSSYYNLSFNPVLGCRKLRMNSVTLPWVYRAFPISRAQICHMPALYKEIRVEGGEPEWWPINS
jgi:hypothetical protein